MKSVSRSQFVDAFEKKSGNFAIKFNGISSQLTIL